MELVRRYSNRPDLGERLAEASRRTCQRDQHEADDNTVALRGRIPVAGRVRDRLTDGDVQALIGDFQAGTPKRVLADRYVVSLSTVKNILRQHGVRRLLELK